MAIRFTGNSSTGITADANGDTWITRVGQYVASSIDAVNFEDLANIEYFLSGEIFAADDGIVASFGSNNIDVVINEGASISAGGDGIEFFSQFGVSNGHDIVNHGTITALSGEGVDISAASSTLNNFGTISAGNFGVFFNGTNAEIVNTGTITAGASAITIDAAQGTIVNFGDVIAQGFVGLDMDGLNGRIENAGRVSSATFGIDVSGDFFFGTNTGEVTADVGIRLSATVGTTDETLSFVNEGIIIGRTNGVVTQTNEAGDTFYFSNAGQLSVSGAGNNAYLGSAGVDRITNTGLIEGDIELGNGDDFYDGREGVLVGEISGGLGNDTILGAVDADLALAISEGRPAGQVLLAGGEGNDQIIGGLGDETLMGGNGFDMIMGGDGNDILYGDGMF